MFIYNTKINVLTIKILDIEKFTTKQFIQTLCLNCTSTITQCNHEHLFYRRKPSHVKFYQKYFRDSLQSIIFSLLNYGTVSNHRNNMYG